MKRRSDWTVVERVDYDLKSVLNGAYPSAESAPRVSGRKPRGKSYRRRAEKRKRERMLALAEQDNLQNKMRVKVSETPEEQSFVITQIKRTKQRYRKAANRTVRQMPLEEIPGGKVSCRKYYPLQNKLYAEPHKGKKVV